MIREKGIKRSKKEVEMEVVQKPKTVNLRLSEVEMHRLKALIEWEQQSAESNKFWILGEPSPRY